MWSDAEKAEVEEIEDVDTNGNITDEYMDAMVSAHSEVTQRCVFTMMATIGVKKVLSTVDQHKCRVRYYLMIKADRTSSRTIEGARVAILPPPLEQLPIRRIIGMVLWSQELELYKCRPLV